MYSVLWVRRWMLKEIIRENKALDYLFHRVETMNFTYIKLKQRPTPVMLERMSTDINEICDQV